MQLYCIKYSYVVSNTVVFFQILLCIAKCSCTLSNTVLWNQTLLYSIKYCCVLFCRGLPCPDMPRRAADLLKSSLLSFTFRIQRKDKAIWCVEVCCMLRWRDPLIFSCRL